MLKFCLSTYFFNCSRKGRTQKKMCIAHLVALSGAPAASGYGNAQPAGRAQSHLPPNFGPENTLFWHQTTSVVYLWSRKHSVLAPNCLRCLTLAPKILCFGTKLSPLSNFGPENTLFRHQTASAPNFGPENTLFRHQTDWWQYGCYGFRDALLPQGCL